MPGSDRYRNGRNVTRIAPVNIVIVILNIFIFAVMEIGFKGSDKGLLYRLGANDCMLVVENHEYYRTFTSAFIHGDIHHLANNMIVLGYLGYCLERAMGSIRYVLFYILACVGAGMASAYWYAMTGQYVISYGASGATFAIAAALLVIVIRNRNQLEDLTSGRLIAFLALTAYSGYVNVGVDNAGHLGGLVSGLVLGLVFYRKRKEAVF